jgi:hypothetical protein
LPFKVLGGTRCGTSSFKKVSGGRSEVVREDLLDLLPPHLKDPVSSVQAMGGQVVKESRWRWAAIVVLPNGQNVSKTIEQGMVGLLEIRRFLQSPQRMADRRPITEKKRGGSQPMG